MVFVFVADEFGGFKVGFQLGPHIVPGSFRIAKESFPTGVALFLAEKGNDPGNVEENAEFVMRELNIVFIGKR